MRTDDLVILQGSTWEMHWPIVDDTGAPAVLTGWSARSQVRLTRSSTDVLYEFAATISGSDVVLTVDAATSSAWVWTSGVYDLEIFNDTQVVRVTQGRVSVDLEVTR